MRYKETDKSLSEIAHELNVDVVVEGTVYQIDENVRIRLQLIDVLPEERNLWTQTYERPMTDVLVMYGEMAGAIAENIQVKLTADETTRFAEASRVNPEVYDAYLKGMFHWQRLNPEDLEIALQYFESALENDPDYALAHAGTAAVWGFYALSGMVPVNEVKTKVIAEAEKAVELDNTLAETHYVLATTRTWIEWDWEKAEESYRRAIELNPNYPDVRAYYSHYLFILHRPDEAIVQMERAMELDPFNPLLQSLYGADFLFMHRYEEAIEQFQKALKTVPNHGVAADILAIAYHQKGMYKEALEQKKVFYESIGLMDGVEALTRGYEKAGYQGAMKGAAEMWEELSQVTYVLPYYIADSYAYAGNKEKTMDWMEKGVEVGDPNMPYIGVMPHYVDLLGDEPRYQDLLRKMNLPPGK
jgi:Tfp pilus assembly protein PilF